MLIWSTQIPVIPTHGIDDLLVVAKKWLVGSPHFSWTDADLGVSPKQGISTFQAHDQSVSVAKFADQRGAFCGFRHQREDERCIHWTTEICGWLTERRFLVSVQLFCEATELGAQPPQLKRPVVVRQILDDLGGDLDGSFVVADEPIFLAESDLDMAMRILDGETTNFLPIIYASSTWRNQPAFDSKDLARRVSGMAHVVVEPSRRFSFLLANRLNRKNPYEGAVAICWPNSNNRQSRLYPYHFDSSISFSNEITNVVREALAGCRPDHRCTWSYIRELVFGHRVDVLRQEGTTSIEQYIKTFDEELTATRKQLEETSRELARVKSDAARNYQAFRAQEDGLLAFGDEQDLYSGEHRDVLIYALGIAKNNVFEKGRVLDILTSILNANKSSGEMERLQQAIRNAVGNCTNAGNKERRALEDIGFNITEEGKHLKLVFRGDDRYTISMPKSGSDHRGMKNWISDAIKMLFK